MHDFRWKVSFGIVAALASAVAPAQAITIAIDYSYDSNNFFGSGNPAGAAAGAQARTTLETVASFFSEILADTFSEIRTPDPFFSSNFDGEVNWSWSMSFADPASGSQTTLVDQIISANEYRIYVGARSISGSTLGSGGPGGFGWSSTPSGGFTTSEINQLNTITSDFSDAVERRGESSGFGAWGGTISFDLDSSTNWNFDQTSLPSPGENDFFSVATHEIGHTLGFGASMEWTDVVNNDNQFTGLASVSEYGGFVPLDCNGGSCAHWATGTTSTVLGTTLSQEVAMDSSLTQGTRKRFTTLDAAGLTDIGWSVVTPTFAPADYDLDGDTDGADFLVWQRQFTGSLAVSAATTIPEPTSIALLLIGWITGGAAARRAGSSCAKC